MALTKTLTKTDFEIKDFAISPQLVFDRKSRRLLEMQTGLQPTQLEITSHENDPEKNGIDSTRELVEIGFDNIDDADEMGF